MNASVDMTKFVAPKSDQLNADDLIGGPRTITVTKVSANQGSPEQPVSIWFEGDDGKPYKPCKSMRRVLVHVWGSDARSYVGRSMTLYCDPSVQFGGMKVGGIRISHMSHIGKEQTMALTATRAKRAPYTVQPLKVDAAAPSLTVADYDACPDGEKFRALEKVRKELWDTHPASRNELRAASDRAKARLAANKTTTTGTATVFTVETAIEALRACADEASRKETWDRICASMPDVPLDVEAVNNEVREKFAL